MTRAVGLCRSRLGISKVTASSICGGERLLRHVGILLATATELSKRWCPTDRWERDFGRVADVNGDGKLDLVVANDVVAVRLLWLHGHGGRFARNGDGTPGGGNYSGVG